MLLATGQFFDGAAGVQTAWTYDQTITTNTGTTTRTFAGFNFGTAQSDRLVVGLFEHNHSLASNVTGITVGGVTASFQMFTTVVATGHCTLFWATVPTGTTGDVVITLSASPSQALACSVWYGYPSLQMPMEILSVTGTGSVATLADIAVVNNGLMIIGAEFDAADGNPVTWGWGGADSISGRSNGGSTNFYAVADMNISADSQLNDVTADCSNNPTNVYVVASFASATTFTDPYWPLVKLLSGFEGSDTSTSFTDESWSAKAMTAVGNAQIDTAQFKAGASSYLSDGTGDVISVGSTGDPDFTAAVGVQFTFECFVRFNSVGAIQTIFGGFLGFSASFMLRWNTTNSLEWWYDGTNIVSGSWTPSTATWYHLAVDRDSTGKTRTYVDGVMKGSGTPSYILQLGAAKTFGIGAFAGNDTTQPINGWIDEFRYTKGIARYGSDGGFTPPSVPFPRG